MKETRQKPAGVEGVLCPAVNSETRKKDLREAISYGLELLRQSRYKKVIDFFSSHKVAEEFGIEIDGSATVCSRRKPILTEEDMLDAAHQCASSSYASPGSERCRPYVVLSTIYFIDKSALQMTDESGMLVRLEREVALVHIEEWLHLVQFKYGSLTGEIDVETDVALFLLLSGIELTSAFLERPGKGVALALFQARRFVSDVAK